MTLRYRGVDYTPSAPSIETTETEVLGLYRGTPWRRCQVINPVPAPSCVEHLKYRGVAYTTGAAAQPATTAASAAQQTETLELLYEGAPARRPNPFASSRRQTFRIASQPLDEASQRMHTAAMRQSLERRLGVARSKGDTALVQLLEREAEQIH